MTPPLPRIVPPVEPLAAPENRGAIARESWFARYLVCVAVSLLLSGLLTGCRDPVTVSAVFYMKYFTATYPLSNAPIVLVSQDGKQRESQTTDAGGRATFTFDEQPGQITVIATLKSPALMVQSQCLVNEVKKIQMQIGPFKNPPKSPVNVIFTNRPEGPAWKTITATNDLLRQADVVPAQAKVCVGASKVGYNPKFKVIQITTQIADSPDSINHEYGHAIMAQFLPVAIISTCSHAHMLGTATSPQCAFVEGWADFFSIYGKAARGATSVEIFNNKEMERYSAGVVYAEALRDEGRVAAGFWDLYDVHNDRNGSTDPQFGYPRDQYEDSNANAPIAMKDLINALKQTTTLTFQGYWPNLERSLVGYPLDAAIQALRYNFLLAAPASAQRQAR